MRIELLGRDGDGYRYRVRIEDREVTGWARGSAREVRERLKAWAERYKARREAGGGGEGTWSWRRYAPGGGAKAKARAGGRRSGRRSGGLLPLVVEETGGRDEAAAEAEAARQMAPEEWALTELLTVMESPPGRSG